MSVFFDALVDELGKIAAISQEDLSRLAQPSGQKSSKQRQGPADKLQAQQKRANTKATTPGSS